MQKRYNLYYLFQEEKESITLSPLQIDTIWKNIEYFLEKIKPP